MLTDLPIPLLVEKQIREITKKTIHAKEIGKFIPSEVSLKLKKTVTEVLAIDIGGDKILTDTYSVQNGQLHAHNTSQKLQSVNNDGYLEFLEKIAQTNILPIGISTAGIVEGTHAFGSPETAIFYKLFLEKYMGDFRNLFSSVPIVVENDGAMGLMASVIEALKQFEDAKHVLYIIVGSGFGGAIFTQNTLYSAEPGHVKLAKELNPYKQTLPCGMFGNSYVCVEEVVGGKAGIGSLWQKVMGEALDGREVRKKLNAKNSLAIELYNSSAVAAIHVVLGIEQAFEIDPKETVIVCEGGIFQGDEYATRFKQLYNYYSGEKDQILFTKDFTVNACLDGAAIAALTN